MGTRLLALCIALAGCSGDERAGGFAAGPDSGALGGSGGLPGVDSGRSGSGGSGAFSGGSGGDGGEPVRGPDAGHEAGAADAATDAATGDGGWSLPDATTTDSGGDAAPVTPGEPDADPPDPDPIPDPCDTPQGATVRDCDGICGAATNCGQCGMIDSVPAYYLFDGQPCGNCQWGGEGYGFGVPAGKCAKVYVQAWAHARFDNGSCSPGNIPNDCLVVSAPSSTGAIRMTGLDHPAWVHYENADLVNGVCPLACP